MQMLTSALDYAARGWWVLPLHTIRDGHCSCGKDHCASPGKHPHHQLAPQGLKNATTDPRTILGWFRTIPHLNIGIRTGLISGIVVVDLDVDHGGLESWAELDDRYGRHEPTAAVETGSGGLHLVFAHPGIEIRNSASTLGPGIDVRGDGGYVVAPPSTHYSGGTYRWDAAMGPDSPLTPLPEWITARSVPPAPLPRQGPVSLHLPGELPVAGEGGRNVMLASEAGKLRRQGAEEGEILDALIRINDHSCRPPLPERELRAIARSISRYPAGA